MSLLSSLQGINRVAHESPNTKFVVGAIDPELDNQKYIKPGVGDIGDRLFGTA